MLEGNLRILILLASGVGIGAIIGWLTNFLAIKMLFRPYNEINILGFKIQGLIPKRKKEIAVRIAETVDSELISMKDITKTLDSMEVEDEIDKIVEDMIDNKLKNEIVKKIPMVAMFLNDSLLGKIKKIVKESIEENKNEFVGVIVEKLESEVDLKEIVTEKVEGFSLEELENLVVKVAREELKHIEVIGGILGGVIGLIQFLLNYFLWS